MTATTPDQRPVAGVALPRQGIHLLGVANPVMAGRKFVRRRLTAAGVDDATADVAELLTSELVTNAVLYAPPPRDLSVDVDEHRILVTVTDSSERLPRRRVVGSDSETGFGLFVLDRLTISWGAQTAPGGKQVWFYLDRGAGPAADRLNSLRRSG